MGLQRGEWWPKQWPCAGFVSVGWSGPRRMFVPHSARHRKGWSHVVGSRAETALQKFAWPWNVFRVCERWAERAERRKRKKLGIERAFRRPTRAHVPSGRQK